MSISCVPKDLVRAAKCFPCVPKQSRRWVKAYLLCQYANKSGIDPVVSNWVTRVVANGGPTPSIATQVVMSTFVTCIRAAGVESQIIAANCFAPDSLIAAQTPLYVGGGNDPWLVTPNAATANTLNVNGWNAIDVDGTHILQTGIIPSNVPSFSANNGGLTAYMFALANGGGTTRSPMGSSDFGGRFLNLDVGTTAGATYASEIYQASGSASTAKVTIGLPTIPGYYSGNRISNTQNDLYFASGAFPHASIATSVAANANTPCTQQVAVAGHNSNNVFNTQAGDQVSFAAIHNGLTSTQSAALFACVHTMRVAFGGGYVGGRSFSTSFPNVESPVSQGGLWLNGLTDGTDWNDCATELSGGVHYAAGLQDGSSPAFSDGTAILKGPWGPNQSVQCVYHGADQPGFVEAEIRLRSTLTSHVNKGYEIDFSVSSGSPYIAVIRWNGALGDFTDITPPPQDLTTHLIDGDVVFASIIGNRILVKRNGVTVYNFTDNSFASGNPGMGFSVPVGPPGTDTTYGWSSFTATDGL